METIENNKTNSQNKKIQLLKETLKEADLKIDDLEYKIKEEQNKNQTLTKTNSKNNDIIKEKEIIIQKLEDIIVQEKNKNSKLEFDIKNLKIKSSRSLLEPLLENTTYDFINDKNSTEKELKNINKKLEKEKQKCEEIQKENLISKQTLEKLEKELNENRSILNDYNLKIKMLEDLNNNYEKMINKQSSLQNKEQNKEQNNVEYMSLDEELHITALKEKLITLKDEIKHLNNVKSVLESNIYDMTTTLEQLEIKHSKFYKMKKFCCFF
jgi:hypothetical protein